MPGILFAFALDHLRSRAPTMVASGKVAISDTKRPCGCTLNTIAQAGSAKRIWLATMILFWLPGTMLRAQNAVLDSLLRLADQHQVTRTLSDTLLAKWEMKIGSAFMKHGKADSCIVHELRCIDVLEAMVTEGRPKNWWNTRLLVWKFLGKAHQTKGDGPAALAAYRQYYEDAVQLEWRVDQAAALDYMGTVHASMQDYQRAVEMQREGIALQERIGSTEPDLAIAYGNLANTFSGSGRPDSALYFLNKALPLLQKSGHPMNVAQAHISMGESYLAVDALDSATHHLAQAEPIVLKWDHTPTVGRLNMVNGALETKRNDLVAAERSLSKAAIIAEGIGHKGSESDVKRLLSQVLVSRCDSTGRAQNFSRSADSSLVAHLDLSKVRDIATQDVEFQRYRDSLMAEERLRNERARGRRLLYGLVLALAVSGLLIHLIWRLRSTTRLVRAKHEALMRAQQRLVESERQREAEKVRTRIAHDVHDQLGSGLTKLVMLSNELKALATDDPDALGVTADDIERVAREANRYLGDIVWAIDPHHDSLMGLTERVRVHCERMLQWSRTDHTIDCAHTGPDRSLDPATKRDIYLIRREALNNAIKYAKARHIVVLFMTDASSVRMEVRDDGVGMTATDRMKGGRGLLNMRQRAESVKAVFDIRSVEDEGTTVSLRFDPSASHA